MFLLDHSKYPIMGIDVSSHNGDIDFYKVMQLDEDFFEEVEGDADSLGGLLLEIKGDFPALHERIDFQNFTFEVTELDGHRISKIKVVIHEKPADTAS